jgi:Uma2 family endonuclease
MTAIVLNLKPLIELNDDQFEQLCRNHRELSFERTAKGELVIVSPIGGEGSSREADLITDLGLWNRQTRSGKVFSSSTCFRLSNGAIRSPDATWVAIDRWTNLTPEQQRSFRPCVLILRSSYGLKRMRSQICSKKCRNILIMAYASAD